MTGLERLLADLNAHASIDRLVNAAAMVRDLEFARRHDYLSLRPPERPIACYAHANRVSIAMDPAEAPSAGRRLRNARLQPRGATTYVIVPAPISATEHGTVLDVLLAAVDWRAAGRQQAGERRPRESALTERERDVCPDCWTVMSAVGTCLCPEDD